MLSRRANPNELFSLESIDRTIPRSLPARIVPGIENIPDGIRGHLSGGLFPGKPGSPAYRF